MCDVKFNITQLLMIERYNCFFFMWNWKMKTFKLYPMETLIRIYNIRQDIVSVKQNHIAIFFFSIWVSRRFKESACSFIMEILRMIFDSKEKLFFILLFRRYLIFTLPTMLLTSVFKWFSYVIDTFLYNFVTDSFINFLYLFLSQICFYLFLNFSLISAVNYFWICH